MIDDLDRTLEKLLRERVPMPTAEYDISFETPTEAWAQRALGGTRVLANLYLYEVRENHDLRDPVPRVEQNADGTFVRRRAPVRVDLFYLVTTWSPAKPPQVQDEHRLLSALLRTFLRYPTLPNQYLTGALVGQQPPLPTVVAQPDGGLPQPPAEFWSAIGNKLRPALNFVVTVAMEPGAYLDTPDLVPPVASATVRVGLDPQAVRRLTLRPPLADARDGGETVTAATVAAAPAARLGTAVFASARTITVEDGSALRPGEWAMVDSGDDSDFVWIERAGPAGRAPFDARPELRFPHPAGTPVRRTTAPLTATSTLAAGAAAGAGEIAVANGSDVADGDFLLFDDGDRTETVRAGAPGAARPATIPLRRALRFAHPAGAGVKKLDVAAGQLTQLSDPANQPAASITLDSRAGLAPAGPLGGGSAVMIGAGDSVEFARLGPIPAAPARTVSVIAPLAANHPAGAPVTPVADGDPLGTLNRAAQGGDAEVDVAGEGAASIAAGAVVTLGGARPTSHQVMAVTGQPGGVSVSETTTPIGGTVSDDATPPAPIAGAAVRLVEAGARTRTAADGTFAFPAVPHGSYRMRVAATGFAEQEKAVSVPATAPDEYRVRLSPA